jgi:PAS domain S-box-containing protein
MSISQDIQSTYQIMKLMSRAKEHTEKLLDEMSGVFAVIDDAGLILRGNEELARHLNVSSDDLLGIQVGSVIPADKFTSAITDFGNGSANEQPVFEFESEFSRGTYLWNLKKIPIRERKINVYVLVGRDVTEFKEINSQRERMKNELMMAKTVQDLLFPEPDAELGNCRISGYYQPATECGGDWWFYNRIGPKIFLWIGDVTGHGTPAALLTSAVSSAVFLLSMDADMRPSKALNYLNKVIRHSSKGDKFMTFFAATIDESNGSCTFANAGHERPLFIEKKFAGQKFAELGDGPSSILGMDDNSAFQDMSVILSPGDRLFFYTDGLTELTGGARNEPFGRRQLKKQLLGQANGHSSIVEIRDRLVKEIGRYRGITPLDDDITFFLFEYGLV